MKGRRRARRAALQALYELDLTTHDPDAVIEQRIRGLYRAALTGPLPGSVPDDGDRLLAAAASGELTFDADGVAAVTGLGPADAEAVAAVLRGVAPQAVYARRLVRGVWSNRVALDAVIAVIAPEWPVDQMAPLDRNIMRMAIWEIGAQASPVKVAISEAVELARQFSGEGSRRMVNGALGAYAAGATPFVPEAVD